MSLEFVAAGVAGVAGFVLGNWIGYWHGRTVEVRRRIVELERQLELTDEMERQPGAGSRP